MQTDPQKIEGAKIAVDNLSKAFGAALLPAVGEAAVKLTELLNGVTSFVQENPKLIANTTQIVVGMLGMRAAVLGARYAWTFLQGPILGVQKAIQLFRGGSLLAQLGRFGPMAMRLASGFRIVATAIGAIGGGPIAVAVAAITAGALLVRKYWEPIKAFLGGVWEGLSGAGTAAMGELMRAVEPLRPAWEVMSGLIGQAWDWLSKMLEPAQYTGNELSRVAQIGSLVGETLLTNFRLVIQVIGGVVGAVVWLGEMLGTVAGFINETLGNIWESISQKATAAFDRILEKLKPVIEGVGWFMDKLGGGVGAANDKALEVAEGGLQTAVGAANIYSGMKARGGGGIGDMARVAYAVGTNDNDGLNRRMAELSGAQGRRAPDMPSPTPRSATTVQQQQTNHITIHQQPGESSEAVARRTADELQRRNAVAARGGLADRN